MAKEIYPTYYIPIPRRSRNQVACFDNCPFCKEEAEQKVVIKVIKSREAVDMHLSLTLANKIRAVAALKPTRWQRIKNFFRRLYEGWAFRN